MLGIALGFLILMIGGCAVGIYLLAQNEDVRETFSDLTIDFSDGVAPTGPVSCAVTGLDTFGDYRVIVTATNASDEPSAYRIDYELLGPAGQSIGTGFGIISRVEPGETVDDDAFGTLADDYDWTEVSCQVTDAVRVAAN